MATTAVAPKAAKAWYSGIERRLWIILGIAYAGWLLDAMDLNFITVVLGPCLKDLLGATATPARIGHYGGMIVAAQLLGWGLGGLTLGIVGDYIGRARALALSIFVYSLFTGVCALAPTWWALALFRFFAAWGVGSEWAIGTALINETWPARSRVFASGIMASAFGFGALLSGLVNILIGSHGWRYVFLVGIVPAILVAFILKRIPESHRWEEMDARRKEIRKRQAEGTAISAQDQKLVAFTLMGLFQQPWLKNTVVGTIMCFAATAGWWGSQTWLPVRAAQLAVAAKANPLTVASWTVIIANVAAAVGMFGFAVLTDKMGRRGAFILASVGSIVVLPIVFFGANDYITLYWLVPLIGLFLNGVFGTFPVWFPEMYPTHLRATGASFCFNVGRIVSAAGPLVGGSLAAMFGGIPRAACFMGLSYLIGLIAVAFASETRGKPLPE